MSKRRGLREEATRPLRPKSGLSREDAGPSRLVLASPARRFDHLFDPAQAGDRVQKADRRQGKDANVADLLTALALAERTARMGADGSFRLALPALSSLLEEA
jgi:hypothetical protein